MWVLGLAVGLWLVFIFVAPPSVSRTLWTHPVWRGVLVVLGALLSQSWVGALAMVVALGAVYVRSLIPQTPNDFIPPEWGSDLDLELAAKGPPLPTVSETHVSANRLVYPLFA